MARLTGDASRRPALWESKIGGVPYHPLGTSWPQSKEDLRPLVFLAQLNLTELNPGGPATQGVVQAATGRAGSAASLVCPQRWHGVYRLQHGDRPGGQAAISTVFRSLLPRGAPVLVESPTYFGVLAAARVAGLQLVPVPADQHGVRPICWNGRSPAAGHGPCIFSRCASNRRAQFWLPSTAPPC